MRLLLDTDVERIYNHFYIDYSSHRYIAKTFKDISTENIVVFVIRHIKPPLQHYGVLMDDIENIRLMLKKDGIKKPIF